MIYLKQLLHRATFYREKKARILKADWMSSITPTCQEAFMINLSRVTSLQNRPSTCWKEKKNLMLIRYLLSAGNRCLSPSSCFAELQGLHAFSWQRLYETRDTLLRTKYLEVLDFLLKWQSRMDLDGLTEFGLRALDFLSFWAIFSPGKRKTISLA